MSRSRKTVAACGAMLLLAGALSACGGSDSEGSNAQVDGLTQVRTVAVPTITMLPTRVAEVKGFFEDNGLDVQFTNGVDFPTYLIQLTKGQLDVSIMPPTAFLAGIQKDLDLIAFSANAGESARAAATPCVTRPEDEIGPQEWAKYAGKTIGTANITDTTIGSIRYLLQAAGEDPDSIKVVAVPPAQQLDQLRAGRIDIACAPQPFPQTMKDAGFDVSDSEEFYAQKAAAQAAGVDIDYAPSGMTITTGKYAKANPDVLKAWIASLDEAIAWIEANPEEAKAVAQKWTEIPQDVIDATPFPDFSSAYKPEYLEAYVGVARTTGEVEGDLPAIDTLVWKP